MFDTHPLSPEPVGLSFSLDEALQELEEIREEVEETCREQRSLFPTNDVRPVPESAYEDARL